MSDPGLGEYVASQRRRSATFATDEFATAVDEPGLLGWAATDPAHPTGRLFVHSGQAASTLGVVLDTHAPAEVAIVESADRTHDSREVSECAEILDSRPELRRAVESATAMLLAGPAGFVSPPVPDGVTVRRVLRVPADGTDGVPLEVAAAACLAADPGLAESVGLDEFVAHLRRPSTAVLLAAATDAGEVVATSGMSLVDRDATVYFVSTASAYRGRGIATAMTGRAVEAAAAAGASLVRLDASAAGRGIYARLGFSAVATLRSWERRRRPE